MYICLGCQTYLDNANILLREAWSDDVKPIVHPSESISILPISSAKYKMFRLDF